MTDETRKTAAVGVVRRVIIVRRLGLGALLGCILTHLNSFLVSVRVAVTFFDKTLYDQIF